MSDTCFRYDVAPIDKYELTPEGYLRAWATIARTGVQQYLKKAALISLSLSNYCLSMTAQDQSAK